MGMGRDVDRWISPELRGRGGCGHVSRREGEEVRSGALEIYILQSHVMIHTSTIAVPSKLLFSWLHLGEMSRIM
jgi:hypothetical protein